MKYTLPGFKTYFLTYLEPTLLAIEAEETGLAIPRYQYCDTCESKTAQFPSIEILPGDTRAEYTNNMIEHWEYHYIDMDVWVVGADPKIIQATLLNYREAIARIIERSIDCNGLFNQVHLKETNYSRLAETKQHGLLKILRQTIEIKVLRS